MGHIAIHRPHFHWPGHVSKQVMWSALLAVLVIGAALVAWWFAGTNTGAESILFEQVNGAA